ncbi:hypothetical protein GCM10009678_38900 [Actinomadura kijaniata]|uniref:MFS family permease n=1 Tax=Actinomadura namibiensis TaxID=182080 RepID=A0A7W3LV65_ACTNM|nr:hypothetical protein [Actinomadura namibiensis]MBA8954861.1 MFS family permease [Actinomadura namibiensis]
MALFGLVGALVSPWRAALVDRRGPRRVLPVTAAACAVSLVGLAASSWQPGSSRVLLRGLAALGGARAPPLGPVMRALWANWCPTGGCCSARSRSTPSLRSSFTSPARWWRDCSRWSRAPLPGSP